MKLLKRTLAVTAVLAFTYCFAFVPAAQALATTGSVFDSFKNSYDLVYPLTLGLGIVAFIGWGLSLIKISRLKKLLCENGINKHFQIATGIALSQDYFNDDEMQLNDILQNAKHAKPSTANSTLNAYESEMQAASSFSFSSSEIKKEATSCMRTDSYGSAPKPSSTTAPMPLVGLSVVALPFI